MISDVLSSAARQAFAQPAAGAPFVWGVATSAFQIEGATTEGGRGESIWDAFCATPGKVRNGETGAVACDHFHRWQDDLALMQSLGLDAYRFSVAWPRVQPDGRGAFNAEGLGFYDRLVDALLAAGIAPHATLYHWDLPQALQTGQQGWLARDTAYRFADYAAHVGQRLGDRLAGLSTHNEPWCSAVLGHGTGQFAPGLRDPAAAVTAGHHLLLSHGLALQALRAAGVNCPLGIVLNQSSATAASTSAADLALARRLYTGLVSWFLDPVLTGRYPDVDGVPCPVAPVLQDGDLALISAPIDFLGINYYTRFWASTEGRAAPCELGQTDMGWEVYPDGLRELLVGLNASHPLPPVFIMENGCAVADVVEQGRINDSPRVDYLRRHLEALAQARAAGVDVRGYFAWSLLDNFEWDSGYAKRFGIVHVDYETQVRTPKASAHWYRDTIAAVKAETPAGLSGPAR